MKYMYDYDYGTNMRGTYVCRRAVSCDDNDMR